MPSWLPQLMQDHHLRRVVIIRASLWTLTMGVFMGLGVHYSAREARETALARVHDHFNKEMVLRSWVTERGGIYVPLDDKTPANPYLKDTLEHEITTTKGRVLTLVNPAYLARMLHERNQTQAGITSRLTSAKPIRPENAPDAWEQKAFTRFETGQREYWEEVKSNGHPQIRYLGALITEQACLPCHAHQGYQVGDIRGAISITVPLARTAGLLGGGPHNIATQVAMFGLWLFGLTAILAAGRWSLHRNQELKQADALLQATHVRSEAILEAAQVGTWEWNIQTGETVFNSVYARLLGYTHNELAPLTIKAWEGLCHPDDHGRVTALAARCYLGELPDYDCELRLRHKEGHWVWLWDRGSLVSRTEAGEALLMAGVGTEITARKQAELLVAESEQRLAWVLRNSGEGVWDRNLATNEITHNTQTCHIFDWDLASSSHTQNQFEERLHPEDAPAILALIQRVSEQGGNYESEYRIRHSDGTLLWVRDRGEVVEQDPAGRSLRMVGSFANITTRKLAELELLSLNERLEARVAEEVARNREQARYMEQKARSSDMGEMVSAIAHQWRQPLNALSVILANVKDAARFGDLTRAYLDEKLNKGDLLIQKMSTTINDFMTYFWGDKPIETFSVRQAILEATGLVEASFQHSHILLTLDGNEDALVTGYPGEFSQVLLNLLFNARDAIEGQEIPNGEVRIGIRVEGPECHLTITDNGGGIQVQPIERIFAPYTSSKFQGSGLGLFLSRRIVEHGMGGKLQVRNTANGAEFTIVIPLAEVIHDAQQS